MGVYGRDMDSWQATGKRKIRFAETEAQGWLPTRAEVKLLLIAGVGFIMDSYDLFVMSMVYPVLQLVYFNGKPVPWGLSGGVLKASANCGNVVGQLLFGFLGDSYGRQAVYGKELAITIIGVIATVCVPDALGSTRVTIWIAVTRFIMGIGVGGDYPLSAAIVADRAALSRRGPLLSIVFSGQGIGGFCAALAAVIVLTCFHNSAVDHHDTHALTVAWRILICLGLVPAFAVVYFRVVMAESTNFKEARKLQDNPDRIFLVHGLEARSSGAQPSQSSGLALQAVVAKASAESGAPLAGDPANQSGALCPGAAPVSTSTLRTDSRPLDQGTAVPPPLAYGARHLLACAPGAEDASLTAEQGKRGAPCAEQQQLASAAAGDDEETDNDDGDVDGGEDGDSHTNELDDEEIVKHVALGFKPVGQRAHHLEFFTYFSEWRHMKILIGTAMTWFLVDIAFYGINLNQSFILSALKLTSKDPFVKLLKTAQGNLIIIAAGYLPGYYFTAGLVNVVGRRPVQVMGFVMTAVLLGIGGGCFDTLKTRPAPFFFTFALLQFFFNFGANATTYVIPAEVFPSRVRTSAHGFSAAVGKLGAIIASLAFVELSARIGTPKVLLIFMGVSILGIPFTYLIPETNGRDADLIDRVELFEKATARNGSKIGSDGSCEAGRWRSSRVMDEGSSLDQTPA